MSDKTHVVLTWLVALLAGLATFAGVLWPDLGAWFAVENGPVETLSVIVWFVAGACLLLLHRPSPGAALALAVVCAGLAIREHGVPPELVPSGKALMRLSHYLDPAVPWLRRLAEGTALLGFVLSGVVSAWHLFRFLCLRRGWSSPAGRLLIASFVALAVSQVMDHWFGEDVLYEEILECVAALLVLVAVQALHQRHLDAAEPSVDAARAVPSVPAAGSRSA